MRTSAFADTVELGLSKTLETEPLPLQQQLLHRPLSRMIREPLTNAWKSHDPNVSTTNDSAPSSVLVVDWLLDVAFVTMSVPSYLHHWG